MTTQPPRKRPWRLCWCSSPSPQSAVSGSGAQLCAAAGAARIQDLATCFGGHTGTKPVTALADKVRRLKSAFHRGYSGLWRRASRGHAIRSPAYRGGARPCQTPVAKNLPERFRRAVRARQRPECNKRGARSPAECFSLAFPARNSHGWTHPRSSAREIPVVRGAGPACFMHPDPDKRPKT